jgi:hypothetical protein
VSERKTDIGGKIPGKKPQRKLFLNKSSSEQNILEENAPERHAV